MAKSICGVKIYSPVAAIHVICLSSILQQMVVQKAKGKALRAFACGTNDHFLACNGLTDPKQEIGVLGFSAELKPFTKDSAESQIGDVMFW